MKHVLGSVTGAVVNPTAVVLQPPHLFELFGMDGRKSKESRLNILATALFQGCLASNSPAWLGLLSASVHARHPISTKVCLSKSFFASPQVGILLGRIQWGRKVNSLLKGGS